MTESPGRLGGIALPFQSSFVHGRSGGGFRGISIDANNMALTSIEMGVDIYKVLINSTINGSVGMQMDKHPKRIWIYLLTAIAVLGGGLALSHFAIALRRPKVEVYFSPDGGAREAVINAIDAATRHVYVAMYYMSSPEIVEALCNARLRGVSVYSVFDDSQRRSYRYLQYGIQMRMTGIPVRYGFSQNGKMHSKFAVIDSDTVLSGSYNWTDSAENLNTEDMTIMYGSDTASLYEKQFEKIWNEGDNP